MEGDVSVTYIIRIKCDSCGQEVSQYSPFPGDGGMKPTLHYRDRLHLAKWKTTKDFGTQETKDYCPDCAWRVKP
jgi:hypothetical protein